ncbi:type I-F CRISPR-associated protein Csy1 [Variovorax terrae]|uniref:Type I-F CRISPR-associated protein Csy1 n=1 Tax=Variovorax terrae TaxID=2923278 RepID=A0A9X1VTN5_9BURK|nr:type I-F CRISPR-associated protein Csy1 [Variovorax terrae]MCJ0761819.1 type I-F CRISPR-associated protein Csy1 [Variovorax terrae]
MESNEQPTARSQRIRRVMQTHIARRLARALEKWEGKNDALARQEVAKAHEKYQLAQILAKGVKANAMTVATHTAKGIHPDLRIKDVTNLAIRFEELKTLNEVGSHLLNSRESLADTTGDGAYNAAAYELYLLLDCRIDGSTLGELLQADDPDAIDTLSTYSANPAAIASDLLRLLESKCTKPATHAREKQVYWLTGNDPSNDGQYHILVPLYPASLVHQAYLQIHPTRYGEDNHAARKARRDGKAHQGVYQEYRGWAVQKLGGTKPQNISHLNSERRGENYLLASLPPHAWQSSQRYLPVNAKSVFDRSFGARPAVRTTVKAFLAFLLTNPEPNRHTRQAVDDFLDSLVDEVVIYAGELQSQPAGWSLEERYADLALPEKLWLDPERAEWPDEAAFAQDWSRMDWPEQVGKRFANWLNAQLQGKLPVGDAEARDWRRVLLANESWLFAGAAA